MEQVLIDQKSVQHTYDTLLKMSNDAYVMGKQSLDFEKFKQLQTGRSEGLDLAAELLAQFCSIYNIELLTSQSIRQSEKDAEDDRRAEYREQQRQEDAEAEKAELDEIELAFH